MPGSLPAFTPGLRTAEAVSPQVLDRPTGVVGGRCPGRHRQVPHRVAVAAVRVRNAVRGGCR